MLELLKDVLDTHRGLLEAKNIDPDAMGHQYTTAETLGISEDEFHEYVDTLFANLNRLPTSFPNTSDTKARDAAVKNPTPEQKQDLADCTDILCNSVEKFEEHLYKIPPEWAVTVMAVALARDIIGVKHKYFEIDHNKMKEFTPFYENWGTVILSA